MSTFSNKQLLGIAAVGALALYFLYRKGAALVTETLNPASDKNIVYDGIVGGIGRSVSGDSSWSLGTWIYDATHPQEKPKTGYQPTTTKGFGGSGLGTGLPSANSVLPTAPKAMQGSSK